MKRREWIEVGIAAAIAGAVSVAAWWHHTPTASSPPQVMATPVTCSTPAPAVTVPRPQASPWSCPACGMAYVPPQSQQFMQTAARRHRGPALTVQAEAVPPQRPVALPHGRERGGEHTGQPL